MSEADDKSRSQPLFGTLITGVIIIIVSNILQSCAVVRTPTGGDKDEKRPTITRTFPEPGAKNYKGNVISLEADEDIVLNDLNKQLLISPRFEGNLNPKVKGRRITFKIQGTLLPNTTYTFNFRKSIVDITEGNPATNPQIIFSTGPDIDTQKIRVSVFHVETGKAKSNVLIGLFDQSRLDSFNLNKSKPDYFAYTDSSGIARINYLPAKAYRLLTWTDYNDNLKYDDKAELLGWSDTLITAKANPSDLTIPVSFHDSKPPQRLSITPYKKACEVSFNEGINQLEVLRPEKGLCIIPLKDKLLFTHTTLDSISIPVSYKDSTNNTQQDTLYLRFTEPKKQHPHLRKPLFERQPQLVIEQGQPISWKLRDTSVKITTTLFSVYKDSTTLITTGYTISKKQAEIHLTGLAKGKYRIIIDRKALQDFRDSCLKKNDTTQCTITEAKEENYGSITTKIIQPHPKGLIITTNERGSYISYQKAVAINYFKNLNPGNYSIKYFLDLDNNLHWTGANYMRNQKPEPIYVCPKDIPVKANWEIADILLQNPDRFSTK